MHHTITSTISIPEDSDLEVNDQLLFYKQMISHSALMKISKRDEIGIQIILNKYHSNISKEEQIREKEISCMLKNK